MRGEHRQATLKLGAVTGRAFRRLAATDQQFELLSAFLTGVLEQRHRPYFSRCDRAVASLAISHQLYWLDVCSPKVATDRQPASPERGHHRARGPRQDDA